MTDLKTRVVSVDDQDHRFLIGTIDEEPFLESHLLEWESEFFGKGMRKLDFLLPFSSTTLPEWLSGIDHALSEHDANGVSITQLNLDFNDFELLCHLEDRGFRSVDTRAAFLTLITPNEVPVQQIPFGEIVDLSPEYLDDVLDLVREGFSENRKFQSRFKNRLWFTERDTRLYYEAWIKKIASTKDALGNVWVYEGQTLGFFLYQYTGDKDGFPVYKGILTAVQPEYRGHNAHLVMQSHLYQKMPGKAWLDNTTQITNIPVIRNHMESSKRLESFTLVLYRSGAVFLTK